MYLAELLAGLLGFAPGASPLGRRKIRRFFQARGDRVRRITWKPLCPGHMSHWDDSFYHVAYEDPAGAAREAACRVSSRDGVIVLDEED